MRRLWLLCGLAAAMTAGQAQPPATTAAVPVLTAPSSLPPQWSYGDGHGYGQAQHYPQPPLLFSAWLLPQYSPTAEPAACQCPAASDSGINWQALPPYRPRYAPQGLPTGYWLGWPSAALPLYPLPASPPSPP